MAYEEILKHETLFMAKDYKLGPFLALNYIFGKTLAYDLKSAYDLQYL